MVFKPLDYFWNLTFSIFRAWFVVTGSAESELQQGETFAMVCFSMTDFSFLEAALGIYIGKVKYVCR